MNNKISEYQQRLNLHAATFLRIDHADAMVAIVYKVTQPDGNVFILKISDRTNDFQREVHFLKFFADKLPVPKIIELVQPDEHIHGAILMECLPGLLLQLKDISESLAYEMGRYLACIHQVRLPKFGDPMQDILSTDPRPYYTFKFEEGLDECKNHLPLDLMNKCRQYYDTHLDLLMCVDGPCVAHRDFRPGNLMVHENKLQGIIDWAGARAGFAEEDLCPLEHGVWSKAPYCKQSFLDGYASIRAVPNYNRLTSFLRLNKAIATIGFTVKRGTWDSKNANIYRTYRSFLETLFSCESF